ncbi:hypothetical protein FGO68_gene5179 [Halteria grandinella]|uniref:Uncharacterized protein n=1 Tax=Halteria grandinella TaxID=5974 RepID=A0A8J8NBL7_HALGN|nr:hypothetical protein FGO68_gene5179 [Halteria grandinella]
MLSTTQVLLSQKNDQSSSHQASMTKSREASQSPSKNEPFLHNNTQLKPDLGTLLQRQKAQLQAEKEKLEKKKYAFESSFGHTLATVSVATNNPDQQVVLQTERSHKESQRGGNNSNMSGLRKYIQAQCPQINSRYANNNNSTDSLPSHQSAEEQQSEGMVNSKEQQRAGQKHETSVQIGGMMISNQ